MSGAIDVTKTFRGEGEDMIAALIAASGAKPAQKTAGDGEEEREAAAPGVRRHGEVVKEKRSFERELVPFDFGDGGGASIAEASSGAVKSWRASESGSEERKDAQTEESRERRRIRRFSARRTIQIKSRANQVSSRNSRR